MSTDLREDTKTNPRHHCGTHVIDAVQMRGRPGHDASADWYCPTCRVYSGDQELELYQEPIERPMVITGAWLTRKIRMGYSISGEGCSITPAQENAVRDGSADIVGDTNAGLRIVRRVSIQNDEQARGAIIDLSNAVGAATTQKPGVHGSISRAWREVERLAAALARHHEGE